MQRNFQGKNASLEEHSCVRSSNFVLPVIVHIVWKLSGSFPTLKSATLQKNGFFDEVCCSHSFSSTFGLEWCAKCKKCERFCGGPPAKIPSVVLTIIHTIRDFCFLEPRELGVSHCSHASQPLRYFLLFPSGKRLLSIVSKLTSVGRKFPGPNSLLSS